MKITQSDLAALLTDPTFQNLPMALTVEQHQHGAWWKALDGLMIMGAQATIWEGTQLIALLFQAYPDHIKSVETSFENNDNGGDPQMLISIKINGTYCFDGGVELEDEAATGCEDIDDSSTLHWVVAKLEDLANNSLNPAVEIIEKSMNRVFLGSAQALEVGRAAAPDIQTWVNAKRLNAVAEQTRNKTQLNLDQVENQAHPGAAVPKI